MYETEDPFFKAIHKEIAERLQSLEGIKVRDQSVITNEQNRLEQIKQRAIHLEENSKKILKTFGRGKRKVKGARE